MANLGFVFLIALFATLGSSTTVRVADSTDAFNFLRSSNAPTVLYLFNPLETSFEAHRHYLQTLEQLERAHPSLNFLVADVSEPRFASLKTQARAGTGQTIVAADGPRGLKLLGENALLQLAELLPELGSADESRTNLFSIGEKYYGAQDDISYRLKKSAHEIKTTKQQQEKFQDVLSKMDEHRQESSRKAEEVR